MNLDIAARVVAIQAKSAANSAPKQQLRGTHAGKARQEHFASRLLP